jgi:sec-independent protein translocase protein TatA
LGVAHGTGDRTLRRKLDPVNLVSDDSGPSGPPREPSEGGAMPGGWEWLIIIGVLVLLFGAKRLPEMARSVGQSARVFKGEMKGLKDDEGRNTPQGAPQQTTRPAAPDGPAALPPADGTVNGQVNGTVHGTGQPGEPVRRDADR